MMEIRYKKGAGRYKISADEMYLEIERIREGNNGELIAEDIVDNSKDIDSLLHNEFDWDNESAGNQWRKRQAMKMIQSIEVIHAEKPDSPTRMWEIVTLQESEDKPKRRVYKDVKEILADPIARDELLGRFINDALSFRKRYHAISELAGVVTIMTAIDDGLTEMEANLG